MVENRELWALLHASAWYVPCGPGSISSCSAPTRAVTTDTSVTKIQRVFMSASKKMYFEPFQNKKPWHHFQTVVHLLPSVSIHLLQIRLCFGVQLSITVHNFFQSFGSKFCFRSFLQLQHIGHMPMISQQQVAAILRRTETAAARHGGPEEQTTPGHFVGRVALVLRR